MVRILVYTVKLIAATIVALLLNSCGPQISGDGNRVTQDRNVSGAFDRIEVGRGIELVVTQSEAKSVKVEADQNLQELIYTKVEGGTLHIGCDKNYTSDPSPKVMVSLPQLHGLKTHSGAQASSSNTIVTSNIDVESESGSGLKLDVEADNINIETSSGSNAEVKGKALKLTTASSSGSNLDASKLETNDVISEASSGSSTSVNPINSLAGKASSGGNVHYTQKPKGSVTKEESSGGSVYEE